MRYMGTFSISSVLKRLLDVVFYIGIVAFILFMYGVLFSMARPASAKFGLVPDLGLLFSLQSADLENQLRIESLHPAMADAKLTLLADATFSPAGRGFLLIYSLLAAVMIAAGLMIIDLLRKIMGAVAEGNPFSMENAKRIRWIGWITIWAQTVLLVFGVTMILYFKQPFTIEGMGVAIYWQPLVNHFHSALKTIVLGAIILIISEVHRKGVEMKEDQDLTV